MFFSKKPKNVEQIDIGKQSGTIWFKDVGDSTFYKEITVVGIYTPYHADDFLVKKASIEDVLKRAYEKGFLSFDSEGGTTKCIPVSQILEVVIEPLEENWITPE